MIHSVRTPFLSWFGGITLTLTLIALVASWGNWPSVFLLSTMFGGAGAAMFFMSARVSVDSDGVIIYRVVSTAKVRWSEVERVSEGGGNLVFYTNTGRITAPSLQFWVGPEKNQLVSLLVAKLEERRIAFLSHSLRASMHVGDR